MPADKREKRLLKSVNKNKSFLPFTTRNLLFVLLSLSLGWIFFELIRLRGASLVEEKPSPNMDNLPAPLPDDLFENELLSYELDLSMKVPENPITIDPGLWSTKELKEARNSKKLGYQQLVGTKGIEDPIKIKDIKNVHHSCSLAVKNALTEKNPWVQTQDAIEDLNQGNLNILLIPEKLSALGDYAIYAPDTHMIGIIYRPGFPQAMCKYYFLNELFTHQIVIRNQRCIQTKNHHKMAIPCLNKQGKVDKVLENRYILSIDAGINRVKQFKINWQKNSFNSETQSFLKAVANYTPQTFYSKITPELKLRIQKKVDSGEWIETVGYLQTNPEYIHEHEPFRVQMSNGYFIEQHTDNPNLINGKLEAFFKDFEQLLAAMENPKGPYFSLEHVDQYAEIGSFFAMFPSGISEVCFPEFCAYMNEYLSSCINLNHHQLKAGGLKSRLKVALTLKRYCADFHYEMHLCGH